MIYLDNAATTQIHPDVLDAMMPYLKNEYGNAGALYGLGRNSANAISKARESVARLIGAKADQIVFTSGGSEANSMVFNGVKDYLKEIGKTHIVVSKIEHDSVLKAAKNLIKDGFYITYLSVGRDGKIDIDELSGLISQGDVGLVSVMYVNNEIGSINPIHDIGIMCEKNGVLFHTDCVQAVGCHPIDVDNVRCDFLSVSAHKIHAPKGTGALYVKDKNKLTSLIHGGAFQEHGLRGGTENVAGIVGFGHACNMFYDTCGLLSNAVSYSRRLFFNRLRDALSMCGLKDILSVNGSTIDEPGRTLNLRFKNIDGETLVLALDSKGVCVSAGSACRSHESEPSHVLLSIGLSPDEARDSIRVSFSILNTVDEVINAAEIIADLVKTIKQQGGV